MIALGLPLPPGGLPPVAAPILPAGCVIAFAGEVGSPAATYVSDLERWGWMICDGRALVICQYPELFAALGFRYALPGDSTALPTDPSAAATATFRLPDYRGMFLRGVNGADGKGGVDPDTGARTSPAGAASSEVGSRQQHALQNHEHTFLQVTQATGGTGPAVAGLATQKALTLDAPQPDGNASEFFTSVHETRPKNTYVYYLIRTGNGLGGVASLGGLGAPVGPQLAAPLAPRGGR